MLLVRSVTPVNAALLDGSRVQFVATANRSDHIDGGYLATEGWVRRAAGSNANSVAEYVVAATLEIAIRPAVPVRDRTLASSASATWASARPLRRAAPHARLQNDPPRQRAEQLPNSSRWTAFSPRPYHHLTSR